MPAPPVLRMDGQAQDQGSLRPLAGMEDGDGVVPLVGDHAAAGPELQLAHVALPVVEGEALRVQRCAAVPRLHQKAGVVGPAEAVGGQLLARRRAISDMTPTSFREVGAFDRVTSMAL